MRSDEHAEHHRVDEGDLAEIHDRARLARGEGVLQGLANPGRVGQVERAGLLDDDGLADRRPGPDGGAGGVGRIAPGHGWLAAELPDQLVEEPIA